ncbi:hypothetical protein KI387_006676 [Taxus chinensis]|uniref:Myb-like domain-containing protein n=1 Tax=Taxus chinensis TaxID=29808 RepID=A0AA38GQH9_TAXCH|nr:hypothetical protein KI387_006676 [Taxus chinensis]
MQSGGGQYGVPGIQQFMVEGCSPHGLFAALSTTTSTSSHHHDNINTSAIAHHHLQPQHINQHLHIQQQQQQSFQNQRLQQQQLGMQAAVAAEAPGEARPRDLIGLGDKTNKIFGFREATTPGGGGGSSSVNIHGVSDQVATHVIQQHQQQQPLTDDDGDGERGGGGINRWPMEETLALLRIRSQMDSNFRDSNVKGPLWENVSRKLAELGYHRSAKKCKEKFENVNKYHKKTKDGRMGRQDGKSYRYFNELEALSNTIRHHLGTRPDRGFNDIQEGDQLHQSMIMAAETSNAALNISSGTNNTSEEEDEYDNKNNGSIVKSSPPPSRIKKRKRKQHFQSMAIFFESLVKQLMEHQEELHRKFLEAIERREQERLNREEAWRRQEMARLTRETEIRAQEQALASTREAALVAFLQKFTGEDLKLPTAATEDHHRQDAAAVQEEQLEKDAMSDPCNSKRWPKPEVQSLIRLRSSMEARFQEPGVKGPLWEEISSGMACLGFHRSAKRCKEKWENINKYFRKTKDSMKKRPENAKTCPYFHQLDALYGKGLLASSAAGTNKAKGHGHSSDTLMLDQGGGDDGDTNDNNNNSNGNIGEDDEVEVQAQTRSDSELLAIMPADHNQPAAASAVMKNNAEHFFQEDHAAHQSPKRLKTNNSQAPNSLGLSFELSGTSKLHPSLDGHKKATNMERLVKEMLEMQQQKFLDDFERREQEQDRQQGMNNHGQDRQQGETQDERSQSALMALVHKLTVNAADYAAQ